MSRIGLTGTTSVGKTTLVNALSQLPQFKDYYIATERSKYLRDLGIPLNTDSTLKGQIIFAAERSSELLHPDLLTDRTIIDVCAFTFASQSIQDHQKKKALELFKELIQEYDVIIYISPEGVEIEDNGVRTTDPDYRKGIDLIIQDILKLFPPKKLIKVSGTTEERIEQILNSIDI